jgi:hypothetical protein
VHIPDVINFLKKPDAEKTTPQALINNIIDTCCADSIGIRQSSLATWHSFAASIVDAVKFVLKKNVLLHARSIKSKRMKRICSIQGRAALGTEVCMYIPACLIFWRYG